VIHDAALLGTGSQAAPAVIDDNAIEAAAKGLRARALCLFPKTISPNYNVA